MPLATVTFAQVILALHIIAVVAAFGVLFADPLFMLVGARLDPRSMAWFHQMQATVARRLTSPGLLLVVIFGVILASEYHAWKSFYVQWGLGASIVIGGLEGMVQIPRASHLADLARRDTAGDAAAGDVAPAGAATATLSAEYHALARQVLIGSGLVVLIVLATIAIMALHVGA